jgi:hypothetical protein
MNWTQMFTRPEIVVFLIPLTAILVFGIVAIARLLIRHRERMAMIERGMHPDHPEEAQPTEQDDPAEVR